MQVIEPVISGMKIALISEMGKRKKKKKPKILIVDDEVNITLSMVEFLEKKLDCYGAYSYEEAVFFPFQTPCGPCYF